MTLLYGSVHYELGRTKLQWLGNVGVQQPFLKCFYRPRNDLAKPLIRHGVNFILTCLVTQHVYTAIEVMHLSDFYPETPPMSHFIISVPICVSKVSKV